MKQGWEIKILDDVCTFERGLTYAKGDEVNISSKGVLRSNNVDLSTNTLNFDEIKYLREDFEIPAKKKVRKNSLLMCISNGSKIHLGKVALIDDDIDYAFGGFMGLLIPDEKIIHPRYFYYSLISPMYKSFVKGLSDGANINNLKFADIKSFSIAVPPLAEQERIVEILDREFERIDALKANAEQNLQHAKDLFQSALKNELETIDSCTIKDLYNIRTGKLNSNAAVKDGKYPFFTCSREVFSINDYAFDNEAILLAGNNASGDFNVKYYKGKFNAYQRTYVITAKHKETNVRMLYFVLTNYLTELKKMSLGANTKFLKLGMVEDVKVPIYDEQNIEDVVARLDKLNERCKALEENNKKTIALCDDMKQALLRKAFNGEL